MRTQEIGSNAIMLSEQDKLMEEHFSEDA